MTIAATLMPANQNSNSPNELTENRLVAVIRVIRTSDISHSGTVGQPVLQHLGAGDGLEADDDHPEVPVEPADAEARPAADRLAGVVGERPGGGVGRGHLPEHPHHQDDQHPGDGVAEEGRRAGLRDHGAGADEQPGPDHAPHRDHGEVALLEALLELDRWCSHDVLRGWVRSRRGHITCHTQRKSPEAGADRRPVPGHRPATLPVTPGMPTPGRALHATTALAASQVSVAPPYGTSADLGRPTR